MPASQAAPCKLRPMSVQMTPIDGPGVCGSSGRSASRASPTGRSRVSPPATIGCPLTAGLDRWIEASVQPAANPLFRQPGGRDHADRLLWLSRAKRQQLRQHLRACLRQRPRYGRLPAGERPDTSWWSTPGGAARRASGPSCRRSSPEPAMSSIPCSARASDRFHYNHIHVDLLLSNASAWAALLPALSRRNRWRMRQASRGTTASIMPIPFVGPGAD